MNHIVDKNLPILAPQQQEWVPCPFVGGFDFRSYVTDRKPVSTFLFIHCSHKYG